MSLFIHKIYCAFFLALFAISIGTAQNFTTKGVEFWAAYGAHTNMFAANGATLADGGSQKMVFYFVSSKAAAVMVEIPGIGWEKKYVIKANIATESDEMPKTEPGDARLLAEGVFNKGIHITSTEQITVYCHVYSFQSSATTILLPVNICGAAYYTLNHAQRSSEKNARSFCFVIATEDSTEVEITPAAPTLTHEAAMPFTQKLNKGEVVNLFGVTYGKEGGSFVGADLSGTYIRTVNQAAGKSCKKIIVFSGSSSVNVTCADNFKNSSDNFLQQIPSLEAWGTNFIAIPTLDMPVNTYRAMVLTPDQKVFVNGRRLTSLQKGRYYNFKTKEISAVYSDSSMLVAQYITSAAQCGNTDVEGIGGDPEMMFLTPTGYGTTSAILNSTTHNDILMHYVNVLVKANDIDSFKIDGVAMPNQFTVFDRNTNFAFAQIKLSPGSHILASDSTFISYAYGYGKGESYGYNAGFSVQHVAADLGVSNPYESSNPVMTCKATPFRIYFDIAQKPVTLEWNLHNNNQLTPNNYVQMTSPVPDSVFKNNGVRVYRYYLPLFYQYNATGDFPVDVVVYVPDKTGCIFKKNFYFAITAVQKPLARWSLQYDKCTNNALSFIDKSASYGNTETVNWLWNFGDETAADEKNPVKQFKDYGEYNVQLRTVNNFGCYDDTAQLIGLYRKPVAAFEISGGNCTSQDILFKSTTLGDNGAAPQLRWSFTDGLIYSGQNVVKRFADSGDFAATLTAGSVHGCVDSITKRLHIYQTPSVILPAVLYAYEGDTLSLHPVYKGDIKSYSWAPETYLSNSKEPYPIAAPAVDIKYMVTASAAGACSASATTIVKLQKQVFLPSAFSPNGDGLNDTWIIKNIENYSACAVQVYNRWGNKVFYSKGYTTPWNGTFNGLPLQPGAYYYFINLNSPNGNSSNSNILSGSITIIK